MCSAPLELPCDRLARPGRSNGLCATHCKQLDRGTAFKPIRTYRKPVVALSKHQQAVLDDLRAHGPLPYDRRVAAGRLGMTSPRSVGNALSALVDAGLIKRLPKRVRYWTGGHQVYEHTRYVVPD